MNRAHPVIRTMLVVFYTLMILSSIIKAILAPIQTYVLTDPAMAGITIGMLGVISGVTVYTQAGMGILFGYASDKINRTRVAFVGSIIMTIFTLLTVFSANYSELFLWQVLSSFGLGCATPIIASIFSDTYSPERRGRAFGILSIITTVVGEVVGAIVIINLAELNWRLPYLVMGIGATIFTPLLLLVKDPPRGAKEEALRAAYEEDPELKYVFKIKSSDIKYLWKRPTNLFLILNFVDNIPGGIIFTYAISWLYQVHHVDQTVAIYVILLIAAFTFVGTMGFAKIGDTRFKVDKLIKIKLGVILSLATVPFVLIGVNLQWDVSPGAGFLEVLANPMALLTLLCLGFGLMMDSGIYPNWISAITDVNLPEHRATMISLATFFDALGQGLGIFIGAALIDTVGYSPALSAAVLFTVLSFVWWLPALKTVRKDIDAVQTILSDRAALLKKVKP